MKTIDENIQKQLDKPQTWFVKYFPKRIKNLSDESIKDRQRNFEAFDNFCWVIIYDSFLKCSVQTCF